MLSTIYTTSRLFFLFFVIIPFLVGMIKKEKSQLTFVPTCQPPFRWIGKPIVAVTYGIFGGQHVSAAAKQILEGMKLRLAPTRPALGFVGNVAGKDFMLAADGQLGEETKNFILEGDGSKEISKSFDELKALLATPVEAK